VPRQQREHPGFGPTWRASSRSTIEPTVKDRRLSSQAPNEAFGRTARRIALDEWLSRPLMRNTTPHLLDTRLRSLVRSRQDPISRDLEAVHIRVVPGAL
jgi:hypothetical protein